MRARILCLAALGFCASVGDPPGQNVTPEPSTASSLEFVRRSPPTGPPQTFTLTAASHGTGFRLQRELARVSLAATVRYHQSAADPDRLLEAQFAYWQRPADLSRYAGTARRHSPGVRGVQYRPRRPRGRTGLP